MLADECEYATGSVAKAEELSCGAAVDGKLHLACGRHGEEERTYTHFVVVAADTDNGFVAVAAACAPFEFDTETATSAKSLEIGIGYVEVDVAVGVDAGDAGLDSVVAGDGHKHGAAADGGGESSDGINGFVVGDAFGDIAEKSGGEESDGGGDRRRFQLDNGRAVVDKRLLEYATVVADEIVFVIESQDGLGVVDVAAAVELRLAAADVDKMDGMGRERQATVAKEVGGDGDVVPVLAMAKVDDVDRGDHGIEPTLDCRGEEVAFAPVGG